jgi:hypothetical protein
MGGDELAVIISGQVLCCGVAYCCLAGASGLATIFWFVLLFYYVYPQLAFPTYCISKSRKVTTSSHGVVEDLQTLRRQAETV